MKHSIHSVKLVEIRPLFLTSEINRRLGLSPSLLFIFNYILFTWNTSNNLNERSKTMGYKYDPDD